VDIGLPMWFDLHGRHVGASARGWVDYYMLHLFIWRAPVMNNDKSPAWRLIHTYVFPSVIVSKMDFLRAKKTGANGCRMQTGLLVCSIK
jgi:hypothetical protein